MPDVRPFPYDLLCSCGAFLFTPSHESSRAFIAKHFALGHVVSQRGGEGYPVVRRFVIRRHDLETSARYPWVLRDRSRPAYLGHYATRDRAIEAVARKLREERGNRDYLPTRREIREAMTPPGVSSQAGLASIRRDAHGAISPIFPRDFS